MNRETCDVARTCERGSPNLHRPVCDRLFIGANHAELVAVLRIGIHCRRANARSDVTTGGCGRAFQYASRTSYVNIVCFCRDATNTPHDDFGSTQCHLPLCFWVRRKASPPRATPSKHLAAQRMQACAIRSHASAEILRDV